MTKSKRPTPGMPHDGLKGAPDGVNTQGEEAASGADKSHAREAGSPTRDKDEFGNGRTGHGGQSVMGYHGPQQLGDEEIKPGGNPNSGAQSD